DIVHDSSDLAADTVDQPVHGWSFRRGDAAGRVPVIEQAKPSSDWNVNWYFRARFPAGPAARNRSGEGEQGLGHHAREVDEIDDEMGQHDRQQGAAGEVA